MLFVKYKIIKLKQLEMSSPGAGSVFAISWESVLPIHKHSSLWCFIRKTNIVMSRWNAVTRICL